MSKYGYTGGVRRPVDRSMKQDPEGPSIEELNRYFKANYLKDPSLAARRIDHDPRLGGPAFRKQNFPARSWINRNPRKFQILTITATLIIIYVIPIGLAWQRPINEEYEAAMKKAWNKKFEGKWWAQWK